MSLMTSSISSAVELQWGRDRSVAEMRFWLGSDDDPEWLQWGRDRSVAEMVGMQTFDFQRSPRVSSSTSAVAGRPARHHSLYTTNPLLFPPVSPHHHLPYLCDHLRPPTHRVSNPA